MKRNFSNNQNKISMLTCYDFQTANIASRTDIDVLLVGDSLGNVFQGKSSTRDVKIEEMIYHTECVRRGAPNKYIISDLPLHVSLCPRKAVKASKQLLKAGADSVKIEGNNKKILSALAKNKIDFVGHAGLLPQTAENYKPKGYGSEREIIIQQALDIQNDGAKMIVLESISKELAKTITETLTIPTIGIGAGLDCDGQVLVINDMLGLGEKVPKFVKRFTNLEEVIYNAITTYVEEVNKGLFPSEEYTYK